ncbi:MAG: glycosyl hydrolase, partial [Bacteroidota bacterium]
MLKSKYNVLLMILIVVINGCRPLYNSVYTKPRFTDDGISRKAKKLHQQVFYLSRNGIGIGHQDDMAYGIDWEYEKDTEEQASDIKAITGSLPAVFGFDVAGVETAASYNIDSVSFDVMKHLMVEAYKSGGMVTVSWHANNPVSDGNSWEVTPAVDQLLEQGPTREKFESWIDRLADFLTSVRHRGKPIPILLRPWHEMNGSWFWWGDPNCTQKDYIQLWQLTVKLLRDKHKLHNLLYVYAPNTIETKEEYLNYYPGDDFVDILGID